MSHLKDIPVFLCKITSIYTACYLQNEYFRRKYFKREYQQLVF